VSRTGGLIVGEEEGEAMKKHWLRGFLLGVSVALLLGGGVAVAQGLSFAFEPDCLVCYPGEEPTEDEHFVTARTSGWQGGEPLTYHFTYPDGYRTPDSPVPPPVSPGGDLEFVMTAACDPSIELVSTKGEVSILREHGFGIHSMTLIGATSGSVTAEFLIVQDIGDCELYGFVPESGTILLLGSGLAGLAGYATLRWRARA
jgi:hypothetical protein